MGEGNITRETGGGYDYRPSTYTIVLNFFESLGRGEGFNYFLLAVANAYQKKSENPQ